VACIGANPDFCPFADARPWKNSLPARSLSSKQTRDQRNEKQHEKNKKQDFCNFGGAGRDTAETEDRRDNGDNENAIAQFSMSRSLSWGYNGQRICRRPSPA
jgi:hypothetical protein